MTVKQLRTTPGQNPVAICVHLSRDERDALNTHCRLVTGTSAESFVRGLIRTALESYAAGASTQERAESAVSAPLGRRVGGQR